MRAFCSGLCKQGSSSWDTMLSGPSRTSTPKMFAIAQSRLLRERFGELALHFGVAINFGLLASQTPWDGCRG